GSILVASDRGIFRRYSNGKLTQLTKDANDQFPAWSRDGTQIAFVRYPVDLRGSASAASLSSTATEPASIRSAKSRPTARARAGARVTASSLSVEHPQAGTEQPCG